MHNIILFGAPGSGKGTQSAILAEKYSFFHISTGDLLRSEIAAQTELGMKAKAIVDSGKLVSDEIVISMVEAAILKNKDQFKGVIFDGFPRTREQATALDMMLQKLGTAIQQVLYLEVNVEELIKRIGIRGQTSNRSDDNDINIINARIAEYNQKTKPVLDFYTNQGKYTKLAGTGTIEEINARICAVIDSYKK